MVTREVLQREARLAAQARGHVLGLFEPCGEGASAECAVPGCNMGVTVDAGAPAHSRVSGAAVSHHCAGDRHAL